MDRRRKMREKKRKTKKKSGNLPHTSEKLNQSTVTECQTDNGIGDSHIVGLDCRREEPRC